MGLTLAPCSPLKQSRDTELGAGEGRNVFCRRGIDQFTKQGSNAEAELSMQAEIHRDSHNALFLIFFFFSPPLGVTDYN